MSTSHDPVQNALLHMTDFGNLHQMIAPHDSVERQLEQLLFIFQNDDYLAAHLLDSIGRQC